MDYWVSTQKVTGMVTVEDGIVVKAPSIWKHFKGWSFYRMKNRLDCGTLQIVRMEREDHAKRFDSAE